MKFVGAFLAVFVFAFGALAQTRSAPAVIKDECGVVLSLEFSLNGGELARFCFGYMVVLLDTASGRNIPRLPSGSPRVSDSSCRFQAHRHLNPK